MAYYTDYMHIRALYVALLTLSLLFAGTLYIQSRRMSLPRPSSSNASVPSLQESNASCISLGATYEYGDIVDMPCNASSQFVHEIYRYDNGNLYLVTRGYDNNNTTVVTLKEFATGISLSDLYGSRFIRLSGGERYMVVRKTGIDNTWSYTMYHNEVPVSGIDWLTFSLVGVHDIGSGKDISDGTRSIVYAKDNSHVYYKAQPIIGADPETFVFVPSGDYRQEYGKDKNRVYYLNLALPKSDPVTFKPLGTQPYEGSGVDPYVVDKNHAYFKERIIPEADVKTFEAIIEDYAKDKNNVYKEGRVIPGVDPTTFDFPEPSIG